MRWRGENRLPDPDQWHDREVSDGALCARCGWPLGDGDTVQELLRVVAMRHGGLAIQGVGVHRVCWEEGRGEDRLDQARSSPDALMGWGEMLGEMRARIQEMEEGEDDGEGWATGWTP